MAAVIAQASAAAPPHPWLEEFRRSPRERLDSFLRGSALIPPYGLANPQEVAPQIFGNLRQIDPVLFGTLDQVLADWLETERTRPPEYRVEYRLPLYAREIADAFGVVQVLGPPQTLKLLRDQDFLFRDWAAHVRGRGAARDALAAFLLVHADHPMDRRYERRWLSLAGEVSRGTMQRWYLDIALRGLSRLPAGAAGVGGTAAAEDARIAAVMVGLAAWAAGLEPDGREEFLRQWRSLRWIYALPGREEWADLLEPIWTRYPDRPFTGWWKGELGIAGPVARSRRRAMEPQRDDVERLLAGFKASGSAPHRKRMEELLDACIAWAEQTGDVRHLVVSAGRFGDAILKHHRSGDADYDLVRRWMEICVIWAPNDLIIWHLWAWALRCLGDAAGAEAVFWAALHRFPDHELIWVDLARTLIVLGRDRCGEAEAVLRAAVARFPDKEASHTELARFLIAKGADHWGEAEERLRRFTKAHPENEQNHVELARLLAVRHGPKTGIAVLTALDAAGHAGARTLNQLAHLHLHAGEREPAQAILDRLRSLKADRQVKELTAAIDRAAAAWAKHQDFPPPPLTPHFGPPPKPEQMGKYPLPDFIRLVDGPVTRADFGLAEERRTIIGDNRRAALRTELERLLDQVPDSGYAAVVAFRRIGWEPSAARLSALQNAYALRLGVYLKSKDEAGLEALWAELPSRAPLVAAALASLENQNGIDALAAFLTGSAPVADPVLASIDASLRSALRQIGVRDMSMDGIADSLSISSKARRAVLVLIEDYLTQIDATIGSIAYGVNLGMYLRTKDDERLKTICKEMPSRGPIVAAALASLENGNGINDTAAFLNGPAPTADTTLGAFHAHLRAALEGAGVRDMSPSGITEALSRSPKARSAVSGVVAIGPLAPSDMIEALAA